MSDPMLEAMARAIGLAGEYKGGTLGYYLRLGMLTKDPEAAEADTLALLDEGARAARKAALEWMERNVDEAMIEAMFETYYEGDGNLQEAFTAAIRHLSERSE